MWKSILFLLFFSVSTAQGFGFGLGYSSSKTLIFDAAFYTENYSFHFSSSTELGFPKGFERDKKLTGFGNEAISSQYNYWSIDLGLGRRLISNFRLIADLSIGEDRKFLSYYDERVEDNYYYVKDDSKFVIGVGSYLSYQFGRYDVFFGYNTLRKTTFGLRFSIF
jgi:hypothetical protein